MRYVEFEGEEYDARHGGPFDRGAADSYYGRSFDPHFFIGATNTTPRVDRSEMSDRQVEEYYKGYAYNESTGDKKDWG